MDSNITNTIYFIIIRRDTKGQKTKKLCKKIELSEPETLEERTSDQNKEPTRVPGMVPEGWFHAFFTGTFSTG